MKSPFEKYIVYLFILSLSNNKIDLKHVSVTTVQKKEKKSGRGAV